MTTTATKILTTFSAAAAAATFLLCTNKSGNIVVVNSYSFGGLVVPRRQQLDRQHRISTMMTTTTTSSTTTNARKRQRRPLLILQQALSTDFDQDFAVKSVVLNETADEMLLSSSYSPSSASTFQQPSVEATVSSSSLTSTESSMSSVLGWRAVIVALCALWASNFTVAKLVMGVDGVDSSLYALSRFGVAALALAPFALKGWQKANMDATTLRTSIICGSWVAFGYLGQTLGLLTTTASKSCVICSLHCVFVATVAEFWRVQKANKQLEEALGNSGDEGKVDDQMMPAAGGTRFDLKQLIPAIIAVIGVAIVELKGAGGAPTIGDAFSFAQPIGFGTGYLILEGLMAKKPEAALQVSAIKLAVVAAASFVLFEVTPLLSQYQLNGGHVGTDVGLTVPDFGPIFSSPIALGGILYTGLITTALALLVESIAFAKVPATDASLILTTEPLFAAGCGAIALGETFGMSDYVGASLIVGACALSIFIDDADHYVHVTSEDGGGALAAATEMSALAHKED